ncbi:MAG: hypothetical protein ACYS6K_22820 [Planctomycetota bacterium]|jgi:hypothetical protein
MKWSDKMICDGCGYQIVYRQSLGGGHRYFHQAEINNASYLFENCPAQKGTLLVIGTVEKK